MTEQHVTILRRFADRIVLLFDADSAGDLAADRVVQLFLSQPVDIAVASMPDGLDPDEYLVKSGLAAFDKLVAEAIDALEFAWKQLCRRFVGGSGLTDQQKAASEYVELLAKAAGGPVDSIRLGSALARVSRLTDLPLEQLHQRCRPKRGRTISSVAGKNSVENTAATAAVGHADADDRAPTGQDLAERWILGYLLLRPQGWQQVQATVAPDAFAEGPRRRLAEQYWSHQRDEGEPVLNEFIAGLPEDSLKTLAIELAEEAEELADLDLRLNGALEHLAELRRKRQSQQALNALIKAKDHPLNAEEEIELLKQVAQTKAKPDARSLGPRVK
jgi:DNA primase